MVKCQEGQVLISPHNHNVSLRGKHFHVVSESIPFLGLSLFQNQTEMLAMQATRV